MQKPFLFGSFQFPPPPLRLLDFPLLFAQPTVSNFERSINTIQIESTPSYTGPSPYVGRAFYYRALFHLSALISPIPIRSSSVLSFESSAIVRRKEA